MLRVGQSLDIDAAPLYEEEPGEVGWVFVFQSYPPERRSRGQSQSQNREIMERLYLGMARDPPGGVVESLLGEEWLGFPAETAAPAA